MRCREQLGIQILAEMAAEVARRVVFWIFHFPCGIGWHRWGSWRWAMSEDPLLLAFMEDATVDVKIRLCERCGKKEIDYSPDESDWPGRSKEV